jgi:hypothetical protein
MFIKEVVNFDLLVNLKQVDINKDSESYKVARYYSEPVIIDEVSVVEEIKLKDNLTFNRVTFSPKDDIVNIEEKNQVNQNTPVVEQPAEKKVVKKVVKKVQAAPETKEEKEVKNNV